MLLPQPILATAGLFDCLAKYPLGRMAEAEWAGEQLFWSREGGVGGGSDYHEPVLVEEVLDVLGVEAGKTILDGTLGGGGHSLRLLEGGAMVIGMDRDAEAREFAGRRLEGYGERFRAVAGNFAEMGSVVVAGSLDGVLLDLGVSSHQLDEAERGFSFQQDGPLDMRMNQEEGETAADLVNGWGEVELARIFWEFGEEKASRRVAAAIVKRRAEKSFERTGELADFVAETLGGRGRKHPATRVFQALRMAVNEELASVQAGLEAAIGLLKPGGVLAVITFHSLEDRLVKHFFRARSQEWIDRPEWPEPRRNPDCVFELITRKAVVADVGEISRNPRSRSAKLRAVCKR
ncbi:MAG: 16S rRNA (cytosine(1402)-N(4))-methyltransferase RsmH [Verrucomicrobiota bacterium]